MLKRTKLNNKANLKHDDEIEILDFEEENTTPKLRLKLPKIKVKNKQKFAIGTIAVLIVSIFTLLIIPGSNIIKTSARKFLDSLGIYTQEIKNVEIQSDNYDNPGSWHIDKSAEWVGLNKAQVTFDVNSVAKTSNNNYKDIILVLDISCSMEGEKLQKAINDSKELVSYILSDTNNKVALIIFGTSSTIVSEFSNNKDELLQKLDAITVTGVTNYNAALKNVESVMSGYTKKSNRDIVTLFLTDGYPNEDTPNQIGTYATLKEKYPYMLINGVQYEMGTNIIDEIKQITDSQWTADQSTLNNVLFEASISPEVYENFTVTEYISENFIVNSIDDIKVTIGTVTLGEENGLQKITWSLGENSYIIGGNAKMNINLTLKKQYAESDGFYPTNNKEIIQSKLLDDTTQTVSNTDTLVLKNRYEVIYDTNTPEGCTLPSVSSENYFAYQNVTKKTDKLTCDGYLFKGWEVDEEDNKDISKVNDDVFQMPGHDVTIRATWTKQSIAKTMDGKVYAKATLYNVLKEAAEDGIYAKEYTSSHKDSFTEEATQKIYHWYALYGTDGDILATDILNKNNVIFAGHCWQMIRTTDTGGVKMIYNGEAEDNQCLDTRGTHVGYSQSTYGDTTSDMSTSYYYGTDYNYDSTAKKFSLAGTVTTGEIKTEQYTCKATSADSTCETLYYVDTLSSGTNYNILSLNTNSHYSQFGTIKFNKAHYKYLAGVGYMHNDKYAYQNTSSLGTVEYPPSPIDSTKYINVINDDTYPFSFDSTNRTYTSTNKKSSTNASIKFNVSDAGDYTLDYSTSGIAYVNYAYFYKNGTELKKESGDKSGSISLAGLTPSDLIEVKFSVSFTLGKDSVTFSIGEEQRDNPVDNRYLFGNGFSYNLGIYTLKDTIKVDASTDLSNNHYTCLNTTGKCTTLSYVAYIDKDKTNIYYVNMTGGKSIEDVINESLYSDDVNTMDSTIKKGVD